MSVLVQLAWPSVALAALAVAAIFADKFLKRPAQLAKQVAAIEGRASALALDFDRMKLRADKSEELEERIGKLELERGMGD